MRWPRLRKYCWISSASKIHSTDPFSPPNYRLFHRPFTSSNNPVDTDNGKKSDIQYSLPELPLSLVYHHLTLKEFSKEEISNVFDAITGSSSETQESEDDEAVVNHSNLVGYLKRKGSTDQPEQVATQLLQYLSTSHHNITKQHFVQHITTTARTVDYKSALPISATLFLVGLSVGVVTPAMPFVMTNLGLSSAEYGAVISAFGLAKLVGNVPAAVLVERHGRKPFMTYSMGLLAVGVAGIGVAGSFPALYGLRLCTGLGVAALSTAGTLMVTDLSTPLNRAQTFAPVFSSFSIGSVLGPGIGGYLVDTVGIASTMYIVGLAYLGVGALNRVLLSETALPSRKDNDASTTFVEGLQSAFLQWGQVWNTSPTIRNVIVMNCAYWIVLAGSQFTILPLLLTKTFSASSIGQVYTGMAAVQIVGNPIAARVSDQIGRLPVMVAGTTLMGCALAVLPDAMANPYSALPCTLAAWSLGSSMLSSAPLAYVSDRSTVEQRAPTVALLRTAGDLGLLVGAASFGALANTIGSLDTTLHIGSGLLLASTAVFATVQPGVWTGRKR